MINFLITDQNFDDIKSKSETTVAGITTILIKGKNKIVVSVNSLAPFAIYKWEKDGHYAISNRLDKIEEYIQQFGCELTYTPVISRYLEKEYVNRIRNCDIQKITHWSEVILSHNGALRVRFSRKRLFSIKLTSRRGVHFLLKWLKKYLIIAKHECEKGTFIPTLTGGLDTRTLTWFWRDWYHGNEYYLKAVKPDGKNDILKGNAEVDISLQVLRHLNLFLTRKEKINSNQTIFFGSYTEPGYQKKSFNNYNFIYDYLSLRQNIKFYLIKHCCPFVDNLYLRLRHPEPHYMRTLLALLLCPDLLDITLISSMLNKPPYKFYDEFSYQIPKVEAFIQKHHLRERVAKIKDEVKTCC